ncbi:hypothetical protein L1987_71876 [Smallanthus sonchifolius]|uniref:Uncharacterized protein n=1 Tax=Smallanthus sonchifolius TaxID=185202 RepID=A0ACB9ATN4_9ASTR|nr:hypothetical protein L1987_71876 [Smallanthus sonchifolius]
MLTSKNFPAAEMDVVSIKSHKQNLKIQHNLLKFTTKLQNSVMDLCTQFTRIVPPITRIDLSLPTSQ